MGSKGKKLNNPGFTRGQRDSTVESLGQLLSGTREASAIPDIPIPLKAYYLLFLKAVVINKKLYPRTRKED